MAAQTLAPFASVSLTVTVAISDVSTAQVYGTPYTQMLCGPSAADGAVSPLITTVP
jgi:hypothetical protein